jgi:hypothetical protein
MAVYLVVVLSALTSISLRGSKVAVSLYALELGAGAATVGVLAALFAALPAATRRAGWPVRRPLRRPGPIVAAR